MTGVVEATLAPVLHRLRGSCRGEAETEGVMLAKQAQALRGNVFAAFESRGAPSDFDATRLSHLRPLRGGGLTPPFSDKP